MFVVFILTSKNYFFDPASLELFAIIAIIVCRRVEVDYTRQLAGRLSDFWQLFKNSLISLIYKTSPDLFLQDTTSLLVDLCLQLLTILEEIYGGSWLSQNRGGPKSYSGLPQHNNNEDPSVTHEKFERNASEHGPSEIVKRNSGVMPVLQSDAAKKESASSTWGQQQKLKQASEGSEENGIRDQSNSQTLWNELIKSGFRTLNRDRSPIPFQDMYSADEDNKRQPIEISILLDLCFETIPEMQEEPSKQKKFRDMEEAKPYSRVGGIDYVPAFKARGWPKVAREWIKRERKWPSPEMVEKVIHEGYHLVVKPPKNNDNPECDFRISFSHAEYLLSQEMNDIHRECYRCLKKFHRAHFSTQPESLVTFHLKTILMQTMEETDAEMWTKNNRAECMMKLLLNLMEALRKKHLSHFSVKPYNLFSPDCVESSELLETLIEKVDRLWKDQKNLQTT